MNKFTSLLVSFVLSGTGCLRFAYSDVERQRAQTDDAGMDGGERLPSDAGGVQGDAQPKAAGAGGGGAVAGGAAGSAAGSGGAAGRAGAGSDAGALDAGLADAGSRDAGAADAGSGDSGSHDAGHDAGVPGTDSTGSCLDKPGVLLCNGFEVYPFTSQWEYNIIHNGSGELSTTTRHSGVGALRATTYSAQYGTAVRYSSSVLNQQSSGDIWMRYYYYVPSTTQISSWISTGVMSELSEPFEGFSLLIHASYVEIESMLGYSNDGPAFPRDRWVCVELHAKLDSSSGYFEAYLDSARVAMTVNGDTVPASGYTAAEFGIHYADYWQGPVEVFVDDVAVGTARIGCD